MPRIVFVSHTADRTTFKVGSHHYARELALLGYDVLHLSTPYSRLAGFGRSDERRAISAAGPFVDASGVTHLVPRRWLPARASHWRLDLASEIAALGYQKPSWVVIDQPLMHRATSWFDTGTRFCYRPTDLYPTGAYASGQAELVRDTHAVVATSPGVLDSLSLPATTPRMIIENGVDLSAFNSTSLPSSPRRGAVYVGALDHRFDWDALSVMAESLWEATKELTTLIGPIPRDHPALPSMVRLTGAVRYEDVPGLMSAARIGLLPFAGTDLNKGRSPMKLYEYLASGLSVVGPNFVFRDLSDDDAPVHGYESVEEIRSAVTLASSETRHASRAMLARQGWAIKAKTLVDFLNGVGR